MSKPLFIHIQLTHFLLFQLEFSPNGLYSANYFDNRLIFGLVSDCWLDKKKESENTTLLANLMIFFFSLFLDIFQTERLSHKLQKTTRSLVNNNYDNYLPTWRAFSQDCDSSAAEIDSFSAIGALVRSAADGRR